MIEWQLCILASGDGRVCGHTSRRGHSDVRGASMGTPNVRRKLALMSCDKEFHKLIAHLVHKCFLSVLTLLTVNIRLSPGSGIV